MQSSWDHFSALQKSTEADKAGILEVSGYQYFNDQREVSDTDSFVSLLHALIVIL